MNAIVILMQFVPSCIVCLDEINPVAHPIMGGKLEVLQKINNYLKLMKLASPPASPPHPQHSHMRLTFLRLELKRLHIALYLHECH